MQRAIATDGGTLASEKALIATSYVGVSAAETLLQPVIVRRKGPFLRDLMPVVGFWREFEKRKRLASAEKALYNEWFLARRLVPSYRAKGPFFIEFRSKSETKGGPQESKIWKFNNSTLHFLKGRA